MTKAWSQEAESEPFRDEQRELRSRSSQAIYVYDAFSVVQTPFLGEIRSVEGQVRLRQNVQSAVARSRVVGAYVALASCFYTPVSEIGPRVEVGAGHDVESVDEGEEVTVHELAAWHGRIFPRASQNGVSELDDEGPELSVSELAAAHRSVYPGTRREELDSDSEYA